MNIGFASIGEVDLIWPLIVKDIQRSCERGDGSMTAGELWQMCRSGNGFLCIVHDETGVKSASVWGFEGQTFHCWTLCGKDMRTWLCPLQDFIEKVARENGSKRITARGRGGWLRVFKTATKHGQDYEELI